MIFLPNDLLISRSVLKVLGQINDGSEDGIQIRVFVQGSDGPFTLETEFLHVLDEEGNVLHFSEGNTVDFRGVVGIL